MIIGIVGKPSVGKSTFFKAATLSEVDIANYPFTTIKPNHAMGFVKIKDVAREFGKVANPRTGYVHGEYRFVPVDLLDVAGLVPDAHKGEGMGAQFLNDLNQADALIHVIDISGSVNEKGETVEPGSYNPAKDIKFLEVELDYWYLDIMKKGWEKFARTIQQEGREIHKALGKQLSGMGVNEEMAKDSIKELGLDKISAKDWSEKQMYSLASSLRIKTKPMIIAANKYDMPSGIENYRKLRQEFPNYHIVPCSSESELALKEADKKGWIDYLPGSKEITITEKGKSELSELQSNALKFIEEKLKQTVEGTGIQTVLNSIVFSILKYKAIHPGGVGKLEDKDGNVLPDCFLMPEKSTAIDFAYRLHSDFGDNFVKAIDVKTKLPVGKNHPLKHLDIIEIMATK